MICFLAQIAPGFLWGAVSWVLRLLSVSPSYPKLVLDGSHAISGIREGAGQESHREVTDTLSAKVELALSAELFSLQAAWARPAKTLQGAGGGYEFSSELWVHLLTSASWRSGLRTEYVLCHWHIAASKPCHNQRWEIPTQILSLRCAHTWEMHLCLSLSMHLEN